MARTDYGAILSTKIADTSQAIRDVEQTVGLIAPADWGSRIRAMHSQSDYDNVMAQLVEETTTPASIASFTDGANNLPVKELVCTINPTETGTGEKSPSNPYVIGGHTGINVTQLGKNLIDFSACEFNDSKGNYVIKDTSLINSIRSIFPMLAGQKVSFSMDITGTQSGQPIGQIRLYAGGTSLQIFAPNASATVKTDVDFSTVTQVIIYGSTSGASVSNIMFEVSDSPTSYEPYITPTTHTASFGQTVYGGEFVASEGEYDKVRPWVELVLDGNITDNEILVTNWNSAENSAGFILKRPAIPEPVLVANSDMSPAISDKLPTLKYNDLVNHDVIGISLSYSANYGIFVKIPDPTVTTRNAIRAYLTNNPITIRYQVVTPTEITLPTKTQLNTLLGANNIYHDCNGDTEVTYRANGALYVAQH